jgi:hypothetical protein
MMEREWRADVLERLEAVRNHLIAANETHSLRALAGTVGVGPSTLHGFMEGTDPHPRIRRKLLDWYADQIGAAPDRVQGALDVLLEGMPEDEMEGARTDLRRAVAELYLARELQPPSWAEAQMGDAESEGAESEEAESEGTAESEDELAEETASSSQHGSPLPPP